jgi:hypothetical protein
MPVTSGVSNFPQESFDVPVNQRTASRNSLRRAAGSVTLELVQAMQHAAHAAEVPRPAAVPVGMPLAKRLGLVARDLEQ